jgi:hypothetical protein
VGKNLTPRKLKLGKIVHYLCAVLAMSTKMNLKCEKSLKQEITNQVCTVILPVL